MGTERGMKNGCLRDFYCRGVSPVSGLVGYGRDARAALSVGILFIATISLVGCCPPPRPATDPKAYFGETLPMRDVVNVINQNNGRIPSLWAQIDYDATIVDDQKKSTTLTREDGGLLYRRPRSLLLRCNVATNEAFTLGSNDSEFWMKVLPGSDTTWWGHHANIGKPCCKPLPIRPDLVLEVLGVGLFDTNFVEQPVPVMRFNNQADAYMFTWNARVADRWMVLKEVWYDRSSLLPTVVRLFDSNGRVILDAKLSQHAPLETADTPQENWPKIANHYDLFFPDNGTRLSFTFSSAATSKNGIPRPQSFVRPAKPGTERIVQIDQDCSE